MDEDGLVTVWWAQPWEGGVPEAFLRNLAVMVGCANVRPLAGFGAGQLRCLAGRNERIVKDGKPEMRCELFFAFDDGEGIPLANFQEMIPPHAEIHS
jgi:hypothetical protein